MTKASLTVVGVGIKFAAHLTVEAKAYIEKSEKVLYLVNDPAMKEWISSANPNAESLDTLYTKYPLRADCYQAITAHILSELRREQHLCVVYYGHPVVLAQSTMDAVRQARAEGYDAHVLPGISAEDCLFADLLVDPGVGGCQSFEATEFLLRKKMLDHSAHVIFWQVGGIGNLTRTTREFDNRAGSQQLVAALQAYYPDDYRVCLYEAAQYACLAPKIVWMKLSDLPSATFTALSTLYVPPRMAA